MCHLTVTVSPLPSPQRRALISRALQTRCVTTRPTDPSADQVSNTATPLASLQTVICCASHYPSHVLQMRGVAPQGLAILNRSVNAKRTSVIMENLIYSNQLHSGMPDIYYVPSNVMELNTMFYC